MKKLLLSIIIGSIMLMAEDPSASKACSTLNDSINAMAQGIEINHKNIMALVKTIHKSKDSKEVSKAKEDLENMNQGTKTRAANNQYDEMYRELKKSYEASCGAFTKENNKTVTTLINRSIAFNNILAKELADPFSLSKTKKQVTLQDIVNIYSEETNNTAVLLLVHKKGKSYKVSSGIADRESKRRIKTDDLFEIGSASKVFTGIAIFQLMEAGKLTLDTKLKVFYPKGDITKLANYKGQNYWDEVTVGMLLQHTSGFIDYLNVYEDDAKALKILGGKDKHYDLKKLVKLAVDFGDANFKPGTQFKYCNTGFIILGDIISIVSGMDWHDYIQKNIIEKVGMKHTYFGSRISAELRAKMPKGYMQQQETFMPPSLAGSAGEIISTLDDLAALMQAWGSGQLYQNPKTLPFQLKEGFHQEAKNIKNIMYGYALMEMDGYYGHGGQTFGFQSYMTINPKSGDIFIVGVNDSTVASMDLFMQLAGITYKQVE